MVRKSQRLSGVSANTAGHKRSASPSVSESAEVKRPKGQKATPKKSQYFKPSDEHGSGGADAMSSSTSNEQASDFEGDLSESAEAEDDDYDSEEKPKTSSQRKGKEMWRQGVKAGLGPGKQVVIKKPQARKPGKTAYSDDTIHPNTLLFLKDLKSNNDREWLKSKYELAHSLA